MRVLQLIDSLEAGGAERVAVNFANALAPKIERSFLCVSRKEGVLKESLIEGVGYLFLNRKRTIDLKAIIKLKTFIREHKIDIIHAHSSSFFIATLVKILSSDTILIWHEHYGNRNQTSGFSKFILKKCSGLFSSIIVVNQKLRIRCEQKLLCEKVHILANYPVINLKVKITKLKGEDGKRIVCLANLRPDKDHENLIMAFSEVKKVYPDWSLHLVGKYDKDSYFGRIHNLIHDLKLENHIFIYGSCPDVSYILNQSTIGILSSKSEGLPLALLEYGLAGLPSIATDVGDCNQVISTKEEGVLVKSEDEMALKDALLTLMSEEKLRQRTGIGLSEKVSSFFSEKVQINKLIEIYKLQIK